VKVIYSLIKLSNAGNIAHSWWTIQAFKVYDIKCFTIADPGLNYAEGLITPPPRWLSAQLLYTWVTAW